MNVLVVSYMYPNQYNFNVGIFVEKQVKALMDLGIEVTVLAPVPIVLPLLKYFSPKWKSYAAIPKKEVRNNVNIIHTKFLAIPGGILKQYWGYIGYLLSVNKVTDLMQKKKFDIIHIHGSAPGDYLGFLLARKFKIPYILTLHGDSLLSLALKGKRFSKSKKAIENADAVVAVSSKIEKKIYELTDRKKNVFQIFNGYDVYKIKKISEQREKQEDDNLVILFVGNLIPQKGCSFLIDAFKILQAKYKNLSLQIVGSGTESEKLKKQVNKLNLNNKITFWGYLQHEKIMHLMVQSDIFIMPSWNEAFGIVYLEAMSLKVPVIGTLGEGIDGFVIDGENGLLVKPKNVDSIVEKLTLLIENKNLRKQIAEKGYESAKKLTWQFNAKEIIKVYKKFLD